MANNGNDNSIYKNIALDIAKGITIGRYPVGVKIKGRSTLAGHYKVSPETIRRGVSLLEEANVLIVNPGAGIVILSTQAAEEYMKKHQTIASLNSVQEDLSGLIAQQREIGMKIEENIKSIMDSADRFSYFNPLTPFELDIDKHCNHLNKTIGELNFWNQTSATIIAIKRDGNMIVSPGPYAILTEGDKLLIIGDNESYQSSQRFLYDKNPTVVE